jgi:hypothetical protein
MERLSAVHALVVSWRMGSESPGLVDGSDFEKPKHLTVVFCRRVNHLDCLADGLRHIDKVNFRCRRAS